MEKKTIIAGIIGLIAGGAAGVASTWAIFKKHYTKLVEEDVEAIKEAFRTVRSPEREFEPEELMNEPVEQEKVAQSLPKEDIMDYAIKVAKENGYTNYDKTYQENSSKKTTEENKDDRKATTYVLPEEDFGEREDWPEPITLFVFNDGTLTDDDYEPLRKDEVLYYFDAINPVEALGTDECKYFRNEAIQTDIELISDERSWENDVKPNRPHSRTEE